MLTFFLTNNVAAFYLVQQKKPKETSQLKQVHWKTFLVYLVNAPILNTTQIISNKLSSTKLLSQWSKFSLHKHTIVAKFWGIWINLSFKLMSDMGLFVIPHFKLWKLLGLFLVVLLVTFLVAQTWIRVRCFTETCWQYYTKPSPYVWYVTKCPFFKEEAASEG